MTYGPEECHERFCRLFVDHEGEHFPRRVQLSRRKGWRKPENTVVVARPSRWGNPFHVGGPGPTGPLTRAEAVDLFALHIGPFGNYEYDADTLARLRRDLAGRNLACWCPLDQPCHADVLLELANGAE